MIIIVPSKSDCRKGVVISSHVVWSDYVTFVSCVLWLKVLRTNNRHLLWLTALIIDCTIAGLYRHNGAMNKSVKLEPGTTEWNQTCYKDYMWSMLYCNREFLENICSNAEIATCLGVLSYCRLKGLR